MGGAGGNATAFSRGAGTCWICICCISAVSLSSWSAVVSFRTCMTIMCCNWSCLTLAGIYSLQQDPSA